MLPFVIAWMDLEAAMLSEINQTKINQVWSHLYVETKNKKNENWLIDTKN